MFKRSLIEAIKKRHSWRDYSKKPIEPEKLNILKQTFSNIDTPFGNKPFFEFVELNENDVKSFSTYGMIRGASNFIIGKIEKNNMCYEDYGWALEYIILVATDLELGTCWLGGTFKRNEIKEVLNLKENEVIPAITPIGYTTEKRSFIDKATRFIVSSHKRKPWNLLFFEKDFNTPLSEDVGIYTQALLMLRISPSASNRQPWRIIKDGESFHFYLQRTPKYDILGVDLQKIDMGISMLHFDLTLKENNINGKWILSDPGLKNLPRSTEYIASWFRV